LHHLDIAVVALKQVHSVGSPHVELVIHAMCLGYHSDILHGDCGAARRVWSGKSGGGTKKAPRVSAGQGRRSASTACFGPGSHRAVWRGATNGYMTSGAGGFRTRDGP